MSKLGKIARRTVLFGGVAIAGGVAFGTYMVRKPHANPLEGTLSEGEATFNPWVKISREDGITLIVPHADKGQGASSMQAALIAEELDVSLDAVTLDFGAPDPAYYNTALAAEAVPFMSFDESRMAETMRSVMGGMVKLMGVQVTGGSSTVPDSFDKLRMAGAVARETLKTAAANRTGVALADLKTRDGAVILPDGTALPYTDLAAEAATLEPVQPAALRAPADWTLLGKPMQRIDIAAKSTGTLPYGIDLEVPGMVHAAIKLNPRRAEVLSYDASAALGMDGVSDVLEVTNGLAVLGTNTWVTFAGAEAIEATWAPATYPAEQADHWAAVAASFTDDTLNREWRNDGDVEAAQTGTDTLTAEYSAGYAAHAPLEPISAIVRVAEDGSSAEVWAGHQMQRFVQMQVAGIVGCEAEAVTLHNQFIGGSFGHRLEFENITLATEIANQKRGTPIKLTFRREEDFAQDFPRQIGMSRSTGTVKDGKVESWALDIATPSVMDSQMGRVGLPTSGPDTQIPAGAWNMPYAIPNLRVRAYKTPPLAPISSWRSVGAASAGFFAEGFLDELIHAAGADPLAERIRLCNNPVHRAVLEAAGEMANWGAPLPPGTGRGIAMVESFGVPTAEIVEVQQTEDGLKITEVWVAVDVGRVLDPVNFENLVQGGVVFGLGAAMNCEITYADGAAEQANYWDHEGMRMHQCPKITVQALENAPNIRGIGEPPVPPAGPALANAIFAATGKRLRKMPFWEEVDFA